MLVHSIREATINDIEALITLMISFIKESRYEGLPIEIDAIYDTLEGFIDKTNATFLVSIVEDKIIGCIVGTSSKLPFNSLQQASETIWYVVPALRHTDIGIGLYQEFTQWAIKQNAVVIHTASPYGSNLGKAYEKNGYKMFEELYIKVLI